MLEEEGNRVKYEKFVKANRQAMEECLPKKTKIKKSFRSSNKRVIAARQEAQAAQSQYENTDTDSTKKSVSSV